MTTAAKVYFNIKLRSEMKKSELVLLNSSYLTLNEGSYILYCLPATLSKLPPN